MLGAGVGVGASVQETLVAGRLVGGADAGGGGEGAGGGVGAVTDGEGDGVGGGDGGGGGGGDGAGDGGSASSSFLGGPDGERHQAAVAEARRHLGGGGKRGWLA